jgi:hypothetical protein
LNHGGEYFKKIFDEFFKEHSIIQERTPPYSPHNGVAERKNSMLSDLVNFMFYTAGLSKAWWGRLFLLHVMS